jgi:hypothetical protein
MVKKLPMCVALPNERLHELPSLLRQRLQPPEFNTKAKRMGKVIRVSPSQPQYYERQGDHIAHVRTWAV